MGGAGYGRKGGEAVCDTAGVVPGAYGVLCMLSKQSQAEQARQELKHASCDSMLTVYGCRIYAAASKHAGVMKW